MRALPPAIMAYAHHHGIQPHTCSCHRTACARYDGKCSDSTELHTPQITMKAFASPYMCSTDACVSSGERTCRSRAARKKAAWDTHLQLAMGGGLSCMARLTIWRLVSAPGSVALSTRYGGSSIECMGLLLETSDGSADLTVVQGATSGVISRRNGEVDGGGAGHSTLVFRCVCSNFNH